jgi:hypothetical protein
MTQVLYAHMNNKKIKIKKKKKKKNPPKAITGTVGLIGLIPGPWLTIPGANAYSCPLDSESPTLLGHFCLDGGNETESRAWRYTEQLWSHHTDPGPCP